MKKGGYQILDFSGITFKIADGEISTETIQGIYDLVKGTNKPFLISGVKFEGADVQNGVLKDFFCLAHSITIVGGTTSYIIDLPIYLDFDAGSNRTNIIIGADDSVTAIYERQ